MFPVDEDPADDLFYKDYYFLNQILVSEHDSTDMQIRRYGIAKFYVNTKQLISLLSKATLVL